MSVDQCKSEVDSLEFTRWNLLHAIEPWGEDAANWRLARFMAYYGNWRRSPNVDRLKAKDFMPDYVAAVESQTDDEVEDTLDAIMLPNVPKTSEVN